MVGVSARSQGGEDLNDNVTSPILQKRKQAVRGWLVFFSLNTLSYVSVG